MKTMITIWTMGLLLAPFMTAKASEADSLRVVRRDSAIIVTASAWLGDATGAGPARSVLPREVIERLAPMSMASTMSLFPGVFVKDYGGIGGLQLVSLRGGSSAQSLVMLDGARLSSAQNGSIDLTSIPVRRIESAEVQRGGASALYGANALTGVVDMRLRLPETSGVGLTLSQGAFNEWRSALDANTHLGSDVRLGVDVDVFGTRGSFPFSVNQFGTTYDVNRQNGHARHMRVLARAEFGQWHSATVIVRSADRGVPGAVVQGAIAQARALLRDEDLMAVGRSTLYSSARDRIWMTASARYLDQHFVDPDATIVGTQGINVRYLQRDATASAVWQRQHEDLQTTLRFDASHADLQGASIASRSGERVVRRSASISGDVQVTNVLETDIELRAAMRADVFSDVGTALSPLLALRYGIAPGLAFKASWSQSFRPPTFNELYYLNYGTRDLRPERASTIDAGIVAEPWSWCSLDLTAYTGSIRNLIVSVPVSPVITSAQNVGAATSQGAELVIRSRGFDGRLLAQWSYALQFMRDATGRAGLDGKLTAYAVPELASALAQWDAGSWFASLQWSYTGFRYATSGEPSKMMLRPFALTSLQSGIRMNGSNVRGSVMLQCDNLFDVSYQVVRGYPMPGRAIRVIVNFDLR